MGLKSEPLGKQANNKPRRSIVGSAFSSKTGMVLEGSSVPVSAQSLDLHSSCGRSCQLQPAPDAVDTSPPSKDVKYGEVIVLGYNGSLGNGDRGRRRSRIALYKRPNANGVKPDLVHITSTPLVTKALSNMGQHSVSYTLSRSQSVIVEYSHDGNTDMFQIGRSTETLIDFVVTDTAPSSPGGGGGGGGAVVGVGCGGGCGIDGIGGCMGVGCGGGGESPTLQSTISRFACRITCQRSQPHTARVYAAGFDSSNNIFLGERAAKWRTADGMMDGLTTNGVLVMHPAHGFTHDSAPGPWREISVCGKVYALRETRSAQQRGKLVENESNVLQDGSLIDLCGATLLWRSPQGLEQAPTLKQLESLRREVNAARPQCPVGLSTLAFPSLARREGVDKQQPWVYTSCGHVHGHHDWGCRRECGQRGGGGPEERECPLCRRVGPYVPLWMGSEAASCLDAGPPTHAFCPCGHVCSAKTVKYWSRVPLPHGTHAFHAACPFCATWLTGDRGHVRLIYQGPLD